MKAIGIILAIWVAVFHALYIFVPEIPLLGGLTFLGSLIIWLTCLVIASVELFCKNKALPIVLMFATAVPLGYLSISAEKASAQFNFWRKRNDYEATAVRIFATDDSEQCHTLCREKKCWLSGRDDSVVMFPHTNGYLNFTEIVYDQSARVLSTDREVLHSVSYYLHSPCQRLDKDWYFCEFSD